LPIVEVFVSIAGSAFASADGTTSWSYRFDPVGLDHGTYTILAYATDSGGRPSALASVQFSVPLRALNGTILPSGLAAVRIEASPAAVVVGQPVHIKVFVANNGLVPVSTLHVAVIVKSLRGQDPEVVVFEGSVDLPPGGALATLEGNWTPQAAGIFRLEASINGDHRFDSAAVDQASTITTVEALAGPGSFFAFAGAELVALLLFIVVAAAAVIAAVYWTRRRTAP